MCSRPSAFNAVMSGTRVATKETLHPKPKETPNCYPVALQIPVIPITLRTVLSLMIW
ncbi:unnamed protein product [Prunus brigantina]